ncbi:hypothetical protein BJ875DRAFT_524118 [Amylocarpus encephaloides]|uniref:Uncharacterized protein n=1 Tax=Amylocarpus encephaloides TaxID=45428 RepID=A0A9P7YN58_9HELO|nr:hypothetical protein BJ875DRAFT_524118 [Amylocarpus encephaloides]
MANIHSNYSASTRHYTQAELLYRAENDENWNWDLYKQHNYALLLSILTKGHEIMSINTHFSTESAKQESKDLYMEGYLAENGLLFFDPHIAKPSLVNTLKWEFRQFHNQRMLDRLWQSNQQVTEGQLITALECHANDRLNNGMEDDESVLEALQELRAFATGKEREITDKVPNEEPRLDWESFSSWADLVIWESSIKDPKDRVEEHYPHSEKRLNKPSRINMDQGLPQQHAKGESDMVRGIDFLLDDLMALRADPSRSTDWEWRDGLWAAIKAENKNLRMSNEEADAIKKGSSDSTHQTSLLDMYQRQQMSSIPRSSRPAPIPRSQHEQIEAEKLSRIPKPRTPVRPALKQRKPSTTPRPGHRVSFDIQEGAKERRETSGLQTPRPYSSLGQNDDNGQSCTVGSKSVRESLASLFSGKGYGKPTIIPMKSPFYQHNNPPAGPLPNQSYKSPSRSSGSSIPTRSATPTQLTSTESVFSPTPLQKTSNCLTKHPNTMISVNLDSQSYLTPSPIPQAKRPLQPTRGITLNQQPKRGNMAPPPTPSFVPTGAASRTDSMKGRAYEAAREAARKNASEVGHHQME